MEWDTYNFVRLLFPGNRFGHGLLTSGNEMAGHFHRQFRLAISGHDRLRSTWGGHPFVDKSCSTWYKLEDSEVCEVAHLVKYTDGRDDQIVSSHFCPTCCGQHSIVGTRIDQQHELPEIQ